MARTIDLNFKISTAHGDPSGYKAGSVVSDQTQDYINQMQREDNKERYNAMLNLRYQSAEPPFLVELTEEDFAIANDWLLNYSTFYGVALEELIAAFADSN